MTEEPCIPEFIDGTYYGCDNCVECVEAEADAIDADVEHGAITVEEARDRHYRNGTL
ncbi:hypothetical protein [Streptomyces carpaticus]|uniref:Uncharacterized protein n=1 Tax=Streptomyces carpaticus TaxID=285558 RepID=A0ABV4ZQ96_9ACTN